MTFNWGHKLILVFLIFGAGMCYLVYRCVKTNYDLVSKEYYKEELQYQQVIDGSEKASKLSSKVKIMQEGPDIIIHFPPEMKNTVLKGSAWFYYAPDARRDRKIPLQVNAEGIQKIAGQHFIQGNYIVKLTWGTDEQHYYSEVPVIIQ